MYARPSNSSTTSPAARTKATREADGLALRGRRVGRIDDRCLEDVIRVATQALCRAWWRAA